ncbi:MAG TPA: hypothetical protein V6D17_06170, partial [Candidatus Obscuribacterales bacterium]
ENVWERAVAHTKAIHDYDDASPHFQWQRRVTVCDTDRLLGCGQVLALMALDRSQSKRVRRLLVVGTQGVKILSGEKARQVFKLPSSIFNVCHEENAYVFAGRGFGHGLGMSQWGARALAEGGYNAAQILAYYYKDVAVDSLISAPGI